mmetsp:Transcript_7153/g.21906  ORF Transcript_7153/g.21906 Transcript_7153/m.21906 type:complete len:168 (+) Transcript_7153:264-767(+)
MLWEALDVQLDRRTSDLFGHLDRRAKRHRARKTSVKYRLRQKRILLKRVQLNRAAKEADADRKLERRYLTVAQKLLVKLPKGKRATQQQLKAAYESRPTSSMVKWCEACDKYYKASHKCGPRKRSRNKDKDAAQEVDEQTAQKPKKTGSKTTQKTQKKSRKGKEPAV